ncbi:MAG: ABC transporter permease [Terracidiphilus sp.]
MAGLLQDVRYALRQLRKSPGFAMIAVLMLALAICANGTVFSWIDGTMLHPIPGARETGSLVSVMRGLWNISPTPPLSYLDYRDLRERSHSFAGILAYHHDWIALTHAGAMPERIYIGNVSWNYFDVLGVKPVLGRFFLPEEETRPDAVPYVVLSYSTWKTRFAGDPAIVGKTIEIARHAVTVIGVAPEGFIGAMPGLRQDVWVTLNPLGTSEWQMRHRSANWLNVVGRLKPGVRREQATQDLDTIMRQIVSAYPNDHLGVNTISLDPMWRSPFGANGYMAATLPILLAIAGVVLLLTCANVATLTLVRFVSRRREIAIRQSLGAGRTQLIRQMVIEGVLVSLCAGAIALLLTAWTAKSFARFIPPNANPIVLNGALDHNVVIGIVLLAVLASVLCGAFPAWRSSHVPAAEVLKEESASVAGGSHNRQLLNGLVVVQIALSLALLVCSALFLRTLRNIAQADPGFEQDHILTASVGLNMAGYSNDEADAIRRRIVERASALQGVTVASLTDWVPLTLSRKTVDAYPDGYVPRPHESLEVGRADVTPRYFETMGIPILEGRDFTQDDSEKTPRVLIIDQTAASRYWPGQDPLGKKLRIWSGLFTVVGVVQNSKHLMMSELPGPMIYMSYLQEPDNETIVLVRTRGNPQDMAPALERAIQEVGGRFPVFDVRTMRETTQMANSFAVIQSTFAGIFALVALVLATTGIYGVVAYRTELRTHEIGIRVALGAARGDVLRLVLLQGIRLTAVGLVLGLVLAFVLTRFMQGLLYGVSATDPLTAGCVTVLLAGISILACCLPARKAMGVDPVNAIRAQ